MNTLISQDEGNTWSHLHTPTEVGPREGKITMANVAWWATTE